MYTFIYIYIEQLHGFASKFVWMFLGWTPTKFVKIATLNNRNELATECRHKHKYLLKNLK